MYYITTGNGHESRADMRFLKGFSDSQAVFSAMDHARAAVLTLFVPATIAALTIFLVPAGCDVHGDAVLYRWTCLFPGLLIPVPVAVAVILPLLAWPNLRLLRGLYGSWIALPAVAGLMTQVILGGAYLVLLGPGYRALFWHDIVFLPQPFVAGAISGAIYAIALRLRRRQEDIERRGA